eukprot:6206355-Pleurochrysis_carterae.AAC.4
MPGASGRNEMRGAQTRHGLQVRRSQFVKSALVLGTRTVRPSMSLVSVMHDARRELRAAGAK